MMAKAMSFTARRLFRHAEGKAVFGLPFIFSINKSLPGGMYTQRGGRPLSLTQAEKVRYT